MTIRRDLFTLALLLPVVVSKLKNMERQVSKLSLPGIQLTEFPICAFFNSRDEEYQVLNPFFLEAAEQGEKNLHIVNPAVAADHRVRLHGAGMDTDSCEACGQLEILKWHGVRVRYRRMPRN